MGIKLIEADVEKDIEIFRAILNRNRKVKTDLNRFQWLYLQNPRGRARAWMILDDKTDEPIAFTCVIPRGVRVKGKDVICWNCGDFSVDQKFRSLGVALKLRRAAKNEIDKGTVHALYAHPNERMAVIHQRVGHTCIGQMHRFAKILRAEKYIRNYIKNDLIVQCGAWIINSGLAVLDYPFSGNFKKYTTRVIENEPFSIEHDRLFEEVSPSFPIIGERTKEYLNWRYVQNPLSTFYRIEILENSVLKGFIIFHKAEDMVEIKDIFSHLESAVIKTLLKELLLHLRKKNESVVSVSLKENNCLIDFVKKIGFSKRAEVSDIYAHVNNHSEFAADWLTGNNWFMTVGDRDV